jgi:hypothetical protein
MRHIQNVHGGNSNLVSLEYSSDKNIEVDIDDENGVLPDALGLGHQL